MLPRRSWAIMPKKGRPSSPERDHFTLQVTSHFAVPVNLKMIFLWKTELNLPLRRYASFPVWLLIWNCHYSTRLQNTSWKKGINWKKLKRKEEKQTRQLCLGIKVWYQRHWAKSVNALPASFSPILNCSAPVGSCGAKWLPLHPMGAMKPQEVPQGGRPLPPGQG